MGEQIEVQAPLGERFAPVVRLIVGGIAERANFDFEAMDDLQLAVERLLAEAGADGGVTLSFEIEKGRIRARVGPLKEEGLARALQEPGDQVAQLTLGWVLATVVSSFGVEQAADGEIVVRLEKLAGRVP